MEVSRQDRIMVLGDSEEDYCPNLLVEIGKGSLPRGSDTSQLRVKGQVGLYWVKKTRDLGERFGREHFEGKGACK